ncbi:hypothetical protein D3C81_845030 [compost metagenome]
MLPMRRCCGSSGLLNAGAAVSVMPMVSITPMPKRCSNARWCSGGSAADAERQKRTPAGARPSASLSR